MPLNTSAAETTAETIVATPPTPAAPSLTPTTETGENNGPSPNEAAQGVSSAPTADGARMKRMRQILKKALDVAISHASTINLRAFFEEECREEPDLLHALFAPDVVAPNASAEQSALTQQEELFAGELGAQALQTLRQHIESAFHELCTEHDINAQLLALDNAIQEAHRRKIEQVARSQLETSTTNGDEAAIDAGKNDDDRSPENLIRSEQIRVLEAEKRQLDALIREHQMRKEEQQTRLNIKREMATNAIEDLQTVSKQLDEVTSFARDYATTP